jgi:2-hydroxychromene-2-carboxylate isomerase
VQKLQFFFDVVSPYAWLGWHELNACRSELKVEVEAVPTLFGVLLDARGGVGPAEIPAKRASTFRDVYRCSRLAGLRLAGPPCHPFNPLKAQRLCVAVSDHEARFRLAGALLDAAWSEGRDVESEDTLRDILTAQGLGPELLDAITTPAIKESLRGCVERALALGVFGVPTFVLGSELFWGHDRLPHLSAFLRGELDTDEELIAGILARPRGVERRGAR